MKINKNSQVDEIKSLFCFVFDKFSRGQYWNRTMNKRLDIIFKNENFYNDLVLNEDIHLVRD